MASVLHSSRHDDADLARRVAAGDRDAFAAIDARHRKPLVRYARTLLRRSEHDAEDVVQDVLIRAHAALLAGDVPDELRPWLYRLARNRAIDEVRRARWGDEALESELVAAADDREDPEAVLRRKETLRRLVDDLADLPVRQRTALLARELDDQSPADVAAQLGVSVAAAQMLATRARENLIKARAARDADHAEIRAALLDARERGARPSEQVLRHISSCAGCRSYRRELRRLSKQLHALDPALGLPLLAGLGKLFAGGGGKAGAVAAGAAAVVVAATGGVLVLSSDVANTGDPAPFVLKGIAPLSGKAVTTADPIPSRTAVVSARVRVPAGAPAGGERRSVTLACPAGMRVAGMQAPEQRFPLSYGLAKGAINSPRGRIDFGRAVLPRDYDVTVGLLCRRPDANGSIADNPRLPRAGERPGRVCASTAYLYRSPGRTFVGTVFRGQPLAIQRASASGRWVRVVTDDRNAGWLKTDALCR